VGFNDLPPRGIPRRPPNLRRGAAIVAVYALAIAFGVAIFSGHFPGVGPVSPYATIDGRPYYVDYLAISQPKFGENATAPTNFTFHNVTFWTWVTGWGVWAQTVVHGNGTEPNGNYSAFALGGVAANASDGRWFVAPDADFAVGWTGGWFLQVYVEALSTGRG
jgi:hypothetical protein